MNNPIYEIPISPEGGNVNGWTPGIAVPVADGPPTRSHAAFSPTPVGGPVPFNLPVTFTAPASDLAAAYNAPDPYDFAPPTGIAPALAFAPPAAGAIPANVAPAPTGIPAPSVPVSAAAPTGGRRAAIANDQASDLAGVQTLPYTAVHTPSSLSAPDGELSAQPSPSGTAQPSPSAHSQSAPAPIAPAQIAPAPSARRAATQEPTFAATADDPDESNEASRAARLAADPDLIAALQEVLFSGASDLHVTANATPTIRVDGGLRPVPGTSIWDKDRVQAALHSLLSPQQKAIFERELELDFAYTVSANARFRVNYYQQRDAIGGAFRLIPTEIKQLKELGVPESVARFSALPRGLVLVTGPTGSGKSTTLAAMIDLVNRTRADHIVTVEDPIEFLHTHQKSLINQREVGHDTHSFGAALKHVLRQDPDVILIGELRDLETISVALTAAETGHLVFATLHTQDAPQTIDRVIDVFPPHQQGQVRTQLAATLQGVVCQTLVKRASGSGRVVATEVLVTTPAIANLIREGKTYQVESMMQAGRELGMHTMDQHLADLVNTGKITHAAAMEKVHDPDGFGRLISRVESPTEASARAMASGGIDFGDTYSAEAR